MKQEEPAVRKTFDGLGRQQLLLYARELGEHFRQERSLQRVLNQREQRLREMTAASIAAQEEERQWIAYEVHDRIAQTLTAVFQYLQTLESMTRNDPELRKVAARASAILRQAIRETRNIMNDLHPPALDQSGLAPLLEAELRRFQEETGCETRFDAGCHTRPSPVVEVALYRIFQEALLNVRRHAATAGNVTVALTCGDGAISLQLRNGGSGFDVEAAERLKPVGGLKSMRRRAEILGGTFNITSSPDEGAQVTACIPIDNHNGKGGRAL